MLLVLMTEAWLTPKTSAKATMKFRSVMFLKIMLVDFFEVVVQVIRYCRRSAIPGAPGMRVYLT